MINKIKLGASSLEVSRICLGTMTFGEQTSEAEAHSQLDYALERGINFIDTAEMYPVMASAQTQGSTERYIGTWLKKSGRRGDIVLASKIAGPNSRMHWIRKGKTDHDAVNIRATSVAQPQQNIDAHEVSLSPELLAAVDAIHAKAPNPGQ